MFNLYGNETLAVHTITPSALSDIVDWVRVMVVYFTIIFNITCKFVCAGILFMTFYNILSF